ncbi:MAG: hypothetical protein OQK51_21705, partial [Kangiellaceae bacterium]|nr:hypothetical protein [Kangiellaceae bacterium]
DDSSFGTRPEIISTQELFSLSQEQKNEFLAFKDLQKEQSIESNRIVSNYLESHLKNFNYYSDTFAAKDALVKMQGNCLSLAILTKALANLLDVEVSYQLVETTPIYQKEGNLIVSSQHVRTKLLKPIENKKPGDFTFWRGGLVVDYFPDMGSHVLKQLDEKEFFGLYYRNKSAEALINGNPNLAYWMARKSLELNPNDVYGMNMIALAYFDKNNHEVAEKVYLFGLKNSDDKLDLLTNYLTLLKRQKRVAEAKVIAEEITKYKDNNPFKWISLANQAYNERDYSQAIVYYRKASRMAPYLHQPHAGIARSEAQMGELSTAEKEIRKALEKAHRRDTKAMYQAKLDMLSQLLKKQSSNSDLN